MYVDRFIDRQPDNEALICATCDRELGIKVNYQKENRLAYRLFVGAVNKKIVSRDKVSNMAR